MGRAFFSNAYRSATPAVAVAAAEDTPKRWAAAPFDPDADEFLNGDDAVFEDFLTPEEALERAQAQAAEQVAAARAARFDSPAASTDSSNAGTPVTEQPLQNIPAMRWANGQWTLFGTEPTAAGAASETPVPTAPHRIRNELHALPGVFPADIVTPNWMVPEAWATIRPSASTATPPPHPTASFPMQAVPTITASRISASQVPPFAGSPTVTVTPRTHVPWHGAQVSPSSSARLSRAHVAPSMIEVPHMLG